MKKFTCALTKRFRIFMILDGLAAFGLSFAGFTKLVNLLYPAVGYIGLLLVRALLLADI